MGLGPENVDKRAKKSLVKPSWRVKVSGHRPGNEAIKGGRFTGDQSNIDQKLRRLNGTVYKLSMIIVRNCVWFSIVFMAQIPRLGGL